MNERAEQLNILSQTIGGLAAELRQLANDSARWADITRQIVRLGRLYLAVRSNRDLWIQER